MNRIMTSFHIAKCANTHANEQHMFVEKSMSFKSEVFINEQVKNVF